MKITPKTEEEVMRENLLEKGDYQFEIKKAEIKISKNGNQMIEVILSVCGNDGRIYSIFDYLMESMQFKLRHFWYSIGLGNVYESGNLDIDLLQGKCGSCKVFIKEDKTGQYAPKNAIADYFESEKKEPIKNFEKDFKDYEIPF